MKMKPFRIENAVMTNNGNLLTDHPQLGWCYTNSCGVFLDICISEFARVLCRQGIHIGIKTPLWFKLKKEEKKLVEIQIPYEYGTLIFYEEKLGRISNFYFNIDGMAEQTLRSALLHGAELEEIVRTLSSKGIYLSNLLNFKQKQLRGQGFDAILSNGRKGNRR